MVIFLKVKPGSKINSIGKLANGVIFVKIKAPARDGKANEELIRYLAELFNLPKSGVRIISGFTSGFKKLEIGGDNDSVKKKLSLL